MRVYRGDRTIDGVQVTVDGLKHYETFMQEVVANFQNDWEMTETDVMSALAPE